MLNRIKICQPICRLEKISKKNPPIKALLKPTVFEEINRLIKMTEIKTASTVNPNITN